MDPSLRWLWKHGGKRRVIHEYLYKAWLWLHGKTPKDAERFVQKVTEHYKATVVPHPLNTGQSTRQVGEWYRPLSDLEGPHGIEAFKVGDGSKAVTCYKPDEKRTNP